MIDLHFSQAWPFKEGFAVASLEFDQSKNGKNFGYIDRTGKFIIPPRYYNAHDFRHGLAFVQEKKESLFQILNSQGVLPAAPIVSDYVYGNDFPKTLEVPLIPVKIRGLWGYIDLQGKIVIKPEYKSADYFSEGFAATDKGYISIDLLNQ